MSRTAPWKITRVRDPEGARERLQAARSSGPAPATCSSASTPSRAQRVQRVQRDRDAFDRIEPRGDAELDRRGGIWPCAPEPQARGSAAVRCGRSERRRNSPRGAAARAPTPGNSLSRRARVRNSRAGRARGAASHAAPCSQCTQRASPAGVERVADLRAAVPDHEHVGPSRASAAPHVPHSQSTRLAPAASCGPTYFARAP